MQFRDFMNRLAVELGLPGMAPNASGACAVRLDGMTVSFYPDADDVFTAMCPLGDVDPHDLTTQESLLAGNFFCDGIGGAVLSLAWDGRAYLTQRFEAARLDAPQFLTHLERFAARAEFWQQSLSPQRAGATAH